MQDITADTSIPSTVSTTCPYCGVGCGIKITQDQGMVKATGDVTHPANKGKLCVKGTAVAETLGGTGRLLQASIQGLPVMNEVAIQAVAEGLQQVIAEHGADAVAFYVSGQLLTEDYYVANKLIKGFIGTANIDTNSRLCMASAVVGYKRAFGSDTVPASYDDLMEADLLILVGSNAAWAHPILFQQMARSKRNNPNKKVVLIDPRSTDSADIADLHLALKPGSDAFLFNGLLSYLSEINAIDQAYIAQHTQDFDQALAIAKETASTIDQVAQACGLSIEDVLAFYRMFANTPKTLTFYSQGVNQSSSGADKSNAIINVHLATGRVGKVGASPFSITGQPNAMGGREVGGLANQLAAHMDFNDALAIDRVARFWQTHNMAQTNGLKAVDLFKAVDEGKIKAIWIMHTNPVVSMPEANRVREALAKCPLVIVSDNMQDTDTVRLAHICLPAAAWGEKSGTVTNADRTISRQRAFMPLLGNVQPDWWWICEVAKKMGFAEAFSYRSPADIFREHAQLSGFENDGIISRRDFDISGLATLSDADYDQLRPIQWPVNQHYPNGCQRLLGDGKFYTPSQKAHFIAVTPRSPVELPNDTYPFVFNTGRYRDQWHTMTRTAQSARLLQHRSEPLLSMHPDDVHRLGLAHDRIVRVVSRHGEVLLRLSADNAVQQGQVFAPMHWTDVYASHGRVNSLISNHTDPLSGQPESKHAVVSVTAWQAEWEGWMITRDLTWQPQTAYWVKILLGYDLVLWRLADTQALNRQAYINQTSLDYCDEHHAVYRSAQIDQGRLQRVFFSAPKQDDHLPSPEWVKTLFQENKLSAQQRLSVLAGVEPSGQEQGATVCACFQVGEKKIKSCIDQGATSVEAVGQCCQAGTNCGSCVPEIKRLLQR